MLIWVLTVILFASSTICAYDYNDYALHRIARAPQQSAALLVPYPRVGKRSDSLERVFMEFDRPVQKRLYMARVGKRSYVYTPRIGRRR